MSGPVVFALRLLLTISLYAFLAWAFLNLWRDIRLQGALLASRKVPPISLTIARGENSTQMRRFIQAEVTIGRDPACECAIDDDESISGRHARLSYHHNQWWLEDLDSTNGVLLNHEKLSLATVVITGDEFTCGGTNFSITLTGDILIQPPKQN
jgi:pSer/pThr/pTyr-binding forkhead associated (FHA) protein